MVVLYVVIALQLATLIGFGVFYSVAYRRDQAEAVSRWTDHENRIKSLEGRAVISVDRVLSATIKTMVREEFVVVNRRLNNVEKTHQQTHNLLVDVATSLGVTPRRTENG